MHTDPFLGWTTVDKVGYVVAEVSPYEADLDWGEITEPEEIAPVVELLGPGDRQVHCVSDEDSDEDLVDFQTEEAIIEAIDDDPEAFVDELVEFGIDYAAKTRKDHALFVDAFREGAFDLVSAVAAEEGQPDLAVRVVDVEVDQADALPGAEREPAAEHGTVAYGGTSAGITCERPCPASRAGAASGRRPAAGRPAPRAGRRRDPAPVSRIAMPAVACGTNTCSSPSPSPSTYSAHWRVMSRTCSVSPVRTRMTGTPCDPSSRWSRRDEVPSRDPVSGVLSCRGFRDRR